MPSRSHKIEDAATRRDDANQREFGRLTDHEQAIFDQGGQAALDEYRKAMADSQKTVGQWIIANGAQILLELIGVNDTIRCVKDCDIASCLWSLVDVGSFFLAVGKLPAVSKAILKVVNGISKFFDEASKARKVIERTKTILEEARAARKPKIERCTVGFAGAAARAAAVPAMAAAAKCAVHHVAKIDPDFRAKGPHLNMASGAEVKIAVNEEGNLIGQAWRSANNTYPSDKELKEAVNYLMTSQKGRTQLLKVTRDVLDKILKDKDPKYIPKDPKMVERMKMVCFRLQKIGVDPL